MHTNNFNRSEVGGSDEIPVNDIPATKGLVHSVSPTAGVFLRELVTTFMTPGGKPASFDNAAKYKADNGVSSAGLITQVQPQATAAATFLAIIAFGKFHFG